MEKFNRVLRGYDPNEVNSFLVTASAHFRMPLPNVV